MDILVLNNHFETCSRFEWINLKKYTGSFVCSNSCSFWKFCVKFDEGYLRHSPDKLVNAYLSSALRVACNCSVLSNLCSKSQPVLNQTLTNRHLVLTGSILTGHFVSISSFAFFSLGVCLTNNQLDRRCE